MMSTATRPRPLATALLCIAALGMAACSGSAAHVGTTPTAPGDMSPEAGFARDMSVHHAQAVAMAEAIRDRTTDPDLKLLATNIALGQQNQIGRMTGWLDEWQLSVSSTNPAMAWVNDAHLIDGAVTHDMGTMDMGTGATGAVGTMPGGTMLGGTMPGGTMPGLATRPQVTALSTLPIDQAEISFLQLMIHHHRGGVAMASAILARTERPDVRLLATSIVNSQQSEIDLMTQMLAKRGATP
ncbi:unannotated protein [freshwater metagenome]|uniref:Unannotated protein n=1 Tax=freshwater metagenome TaxID=449393 RepID=A0A6J7D6M0_9ZZZZ|nr:DUF305 domain-containing protein [Actinomycetota bacterium]